MFPPWLLSNSAKLLIDVVRPARAHGWSLVTVLGCAYSLWVELSILDQGLDHPYDSVQLTLKPQLINSRRCDSANESSAHELTDRRKDSYRTFAVVLRTCYPGYGPSSLPELMPVERTGKGSTLLSMSCTSQGTKCAAKEFSTLLIQKAIRILEVERYEGCKTQANSA